MEEAFVSKRPPYEFAVYEILHLNLADFEHHNVSVCITKPSDVVFDCPGTYVWNDGEGSAEFKIPTWNQRLTHLKYRVLSAPNVPPREPWWIWKWIFGDPVIQTVHMSFTVCDMQSATGGCASTQGDVLL